MKEFKEAINIFILASIITLIGLINNALVFYVYGAPIPTAIQILSPLFCILLAYVLLITFKDNNNGT